MAKRNFPDMTNLLGNEGEERDVDMSASERNEDRLEYYQPMPHFHYSSSPPSSPSSARDLPSSSPPSSPGSRFDEEFAEVADDKRSSFRSYWTRQGTQDKTSKESDNEEEANRMSVASSSNACVDTKNNAGKRRRSIEVVTPPRRDGGKRSRPRFHERSSDELEDDDLTPKPTLFSGFKNDEMHYNRHLESAVSSRTVAQELWDITIAGGIEGSACKIDMGDKELGELPSELWDLTRATDLRLRLGDSSPSSFGRQLSSKDISRTLSKATSTGFEAGKLGTREGELHLFLNGNKLKFLPLELFSVASLTVLSLRNNKLDEIPPEICELRSLRELNIANNNLSFLPSEMLHMRLGKLSLDPNPFTKRMMTSLKSNAAGEVAVTQIHKVVPLKEVCLRVLATSVQASFDRVHMFNFPSTENWVLTNLENTYEVPLDLVGWKLSEPVQKLLLHCIPNSVSTEIKGDPAAERRKRVPLRARVSECSSRAHLVLDRGAQYRKPIFVSHVEECTTWERVIAGVKVGGESGIPVRWRGCSPGCLNFLRNPVGGSDGDAALKEGGDDDEFDWSIGGGGAQSIGRQMGQSEFSSAGFEFDD